MTSDVGVHLLGGEGEFLALARDLENVETVFLFNDAYDDAVAPVTVVEKLVADG